MVKISAFQLLYSYTQESHFASLQRRHNEHDGVSNHQPHDFYSTV